MAENSRFQFVNRLTEREELSGHLAAFGDRRAHLVVGSTGVGKSELVAQVFRDIKPAYPALKVEIRLSGDGVSADGLYLSRICRAIDSHAAQVPDYTTVEKFALTKIGRDALAETAKAASELLVVTEVLANVHAAMEKRRAAAQSFLENFSDSQTVGFMQEYATRQLSQGRFVLDIENIQSIDDLSKRVLEAILAECSDFFLIAEYTTGMPRARAVSDITEYLERIVGGRVMATQINKLEAEAVRNIPVLPSMQITDVINEQLESWDGNIRSIKDLVIIAEGDGCAIRKGDGTSQRIASLGGDARWLLIAICAHHGPTPVSLAEEVFEAGPVQSSFSHAMEQLWDFVDVYAGGDIQLQHDTIDAIINKDRGYQGILRLAMTLWNNIYRNELAESAPRVTSATALIKTLYFSCTLQDFLAILDILERLRDEALRSRNPRYIIDQIATLHFDAVPSNDRYRVSRTINKWLVDVYHSTDRPYEALARLREIDEESADTKFWQALLLEQASKHEEARAFCFDELSECVEPDSTHALRLKLILMQAEFCLLHFPAVDRLFHELLHNESYRHTFEYGFVLRNATYLTERGYTEKGLSGLSYVDVMPYLTASIEHFESFGGWKQAASSRNTYAIYLALCGRFDEAKTEFEAALAKSDTFLGSKNWMLNNLAVLAHFNDDPREAESLAKQGLRYANESFDQLALYINLLVVRIRMHEDASTIIDRMEELIQVHGFADTEILRYAYFNMSKYYMGRGDAGRAEECMTRFRKYGDAPGSSWSHWLNGALLDENDQERFRATLEWPLSFNDGWGIEYDRNLMPPG